MNEEAPPTPPPVPDDPRGPQPDEQPTAVLGEQVASYPQPGAQPAAYPPPSNQQPSGADLPPGPAFPPGAYQQSAAPEQPAGYQQTAAYPQPSAYQQPGSYQQPGGYQQTGAYQQSGAGAYPPQPGAYQQPGAYPPQPGAYLPPRPAGPGRRLTRSRSQRVIGGVCGGLARYWNTDPLLLRILAVVLTLATGGALLIGYVIAWIAIPDEPMSPMGPQGQPPEHVGYAAGGNPGYSDAEFAQYPPPAPRERSHLGALTVSIAVLVAGVLALIGFLVPASVGIWGVILGVCLAILGLGMLVGARYGRARWLLWLAIPLAFLTFGTVAAGNYVSDNPNWARWTEARGGAGQWGGLTVGDRTWPVTPADVPDSPLTYRLSAGSAVLDLTELTALGDAESARPGQRVEIEAGVGFGELVVIIPSDLQLDLAGTVDIGEINVPGSDLVNGSDLQVDTTFEPLTEGQPAYLVTVDAAIGVGALEVRREAA